jgi:hypothetical protein
MKGGVKMLVPFKVTDFHGKIYHVDAQDATHAKKLVCHLRGRPVTYAEYSTLKAEKVKE